MKKIEQSEVKFEGFDLDKRRAYIAINIDNLEEDQKMKLKRIIPERTTNHGTRPTMSSISAKWDPKQQWDLTKVTPTNKERIEIIAAVVEIAIKILFKNFSYKFGGKFYHQSEGGPIGVRATGAASDLIMEDWAEEYRKIPPGSLPTLWVCR